MVVRPIEETNVDKICQMARINFETVVRFAYTFLKPLKPQGSGFVLNISSVAGTMIPPLGGVYAGSKHAVEAFTEALWGKLTGSGVGVAVIEPGMVETSLYKDCDQKSKDWVHGQGALAAEAIAACASPTMCGWCACSRCRPAARPEGDAGRGPIDP